MKVAILGFELEGQASMAYWQAQDAEITVCDQDPDKQVPAGVARQLGPDYLKDLDRFDILMRTPGLKPADILGADPGVAGKITTNADEFLRVCPTKNTIGVTGTKGKGTTSTLIARMLEAAGKRVHLGGNIGVPPLALLNNDIRSDDWVVLELSSFQLADIRRSPHIAVCLMIAPEHLNWHGTIEEYTGAKQQLFSHQTGQDIAIYFSQNEDSKRIASTSPGMLIPYFTQPGACVENGEIRIGGNVICKTSEIELLGVHNQQNVCAAVTAAWQATQNTEALHSVAASFKGLPFRLEFRQEVNGVRYFNDSFASAPPAPLAAIAAIPGTKVMILGGFDRGLDLDELVSGLVKAGNSIRSAVLIGQTAEKLAVALQAKGFDRYTVCRATDMETIVKQAASAAQPGDAVVLSPGFASFDMFKNFEDRGRKFNEAVAAL